LDFYRQAMLTSPQVPAFWLYGDIHPDPEPRFVHAERIRTRARVHDWFIDIHRHPDLAQALYLSRGEAVATVDGERVRLPAPAIVWLPADVPHGYDFAAGSDGFVVTISQDFLTAILSPETRQDLGPGIEQAFFAGIGEEEETGIDAEAAFAGIDHAVGLGGAAVRTIVEAQLKLLLALVVRLRAAHGFSARSQPPEAAILRRFRQLVETRFRQHWPVADYASALGLSEDRLHALTTRAAGVPPKEILQRRLLLEAKRHLLYTHMSVKEIAYDLGFADPAYFSRFFAKRAGMAPSAYRAGDAG
jgi:AraC family transcriptional regulator, transcriptional activator of pobA